MKGRGPDHEIEFCDDKTKPHGRTSPQRIHSKIRCLCEANRSSEFGRGSEETHHRLLCFDSKESGEFKIRLPSTARALEALARLAEASARIRLSETASIQDAERAVRLTKTWRYDLMGEISMKPIASNQKGKPDMQNGALLDIVERLS